MNGERDTLHRVLTCCCSFTYALNLKLDEPMCALTILQAMVKGISSKGMIVTTLGFETKPGDMLRDPSSCFEVARSIQVG